MEQINSLILYKDWLMLTRGKIEPKENDRIIYNENIDFVISGDSKRVEINCENSIVISECYVEVPYPVIEWKEDGKDYKGYLGSYHIETIFYDEEQSNYFVYLIKGLDCYINVENGYFEGTLNECKLKAHELLYEN